ncbi:MAG: dTMP kinase [Coriobacteriales bacterium]|jgi:dTMP kinase|nr:dTMP kinase [Coriobacteriales bacterium]
MSSRGIFISFEGGEGVGKSTHISLLAHRLRAAGIDVLCLREPGGTVIGEQIRAILLDPANKELTAMSELLLYEAARAQLVTEQILPALARGSVVLCDRYLDSTAAYQGFGRQIEQQIVASANQLGSLGVLPDRTLVLIDDLSEALFRARESGADRLEAESDDFHQRVQNGFLILAEQQAERIRLIEIAQDKRATAQAVFQAVADLFSGVPDDFVISDELLEESRRQR